ncbi:MAG: hypothetical protein Q9219_007584 [cf. Caloplaca sp. 3 TL-2023]
MLQRPANHHTAIVPDIATLQSAPTRQKPPHKQKKRRTSAEKRRDDNIRLINATYAICEGKALDSVSSSLARPVYKISNNRFSVPATASDFQVLGTLQPKTHAYRATFQFLKKDKLRCKLKFPDQTKTVRQPDSSVMVSGALLPFLVIEVAYTETDESIEGKIYDWTQGSKNHVRIIIVLRIRNLASNPHVLVDIIQPVKIANPTNSDPANFRVELQYAKSGIEVYPVQSQETFQIGLDQVMPRDYIRSTATASQSVTIKLSHFHRAAMSAVKHFQDVKQQLDEQGGSSPVNPHQEMVPRPDALGNEASSEGTKSDVEMRAGNDSDSSYHPDPEDDSESDGEPHVMR